MNMEKKILGIMDKEKAKELLEYHLNRELTEEEKKEVAYNVMMQLHSILKRKRRLFI